MSKEYLQVLREIAEFGKKLQENREGLKEFLNSLPKIDPEKILFEPPEIKQTEIPEINIRKYL